MISVLSYDGTLAGLFALLDRLWAEPLPEILQVRRPPCPSRFPPAPENPQPGLFDGAAGPRFPSGRFRSPPDLLPEPAALDGAAGILFQVSADAYDALVYAWMHAVPLEAPALRYALAVLSSAERAVPAADRSGGSGAALPADGAPWYSRGEARREASRAARNRGEEDCRIVLAAAYRVARELDRLRGFLRFKPDSQGRYRARCGPDHFILPALEPHFTRRFGDTPWAVVDERRGLALVMDGEPRIISAGDEFSPRGGGESRDSGPGCRDAPRFDAWERLWRSYHRTINIESRKNLALQRQFVPRRYRQYTTEFSPDCPE